MSNARGYSGTTKIVFLQNIISPILMKLIGLENLDLIADFLMVVGFCGLVLSYFAFNVYRFAVYRSFSAYLPGYLDFYVYAVFIVLALIGALVFKLPYDYYYLTKCRRCWREFAYREVHVPDVTEIDMGGGTSILYINRTYRCSYCGDEKTVTETKKIEPLSSADYV